MKIIYFFNCKLNLTLQILILFLAIITKNTVAAAEWDLHKFRYGFYLGTNNVTQKTDNEFSLLTNANVAHGIGGVYGVFAELPFAKIKENPVYLGIKLGCYDYGATFESNLDSIVKINSTSSIANISRTLKTDFSAIVFSPYVKYNFANNFFVNTGFQFDFPVLYRYLNKDKITSPAGYFFENDRSGKFSNPNDINIRYNIGLSYDFNISEKAGIVISPEINYYYGLTNNLTNVNYDWYTNSLAIGAAFKLQTPLISPKIDTIYRNEYQLDTVKIEAEVESARIAFGKNVSIETVINPAKNTIEIVNFYNRTDTLLTPKNYALKMDVALTFIDTNSLAKKTPGEIEVTEQSIRRQIPLLNYIFFAEGEAIIPNRYKLYKNKEDTHNFNETKLVELPTLAAYHEILNVIGARMQANPNYTLELVGCNDGYSKSERRNKQLSRQRVEAVRDYFVKIWEIDSLRLPIISRNLPKKPSLDLNVPDKSQENRRVEIIPNDLSLLAPLSLNTLVKKSNLRSVGINAAVVAEAGLENYKLVVNNGVTTFFERQKRFPNNLTKENNEYIIDEEWGFDFTSELEPEIMEKYVISLQVVDKRFRRINFDKTYNVKYFSPLKNNGKKQLERFSLILFDFDKAELSDRNAEIIKKINQLTPENANVTVEGYTDRTGEDKVNKRLSQRRSDAVKSAITAKNIKSIGFGKEVLLYDNDLPEGRFYCRTVEVVIEH